MSLENLVIDGIMASNDAVCYLLLIFIFKTTEALSKPQNSIALKAVIEKYTECKVL